MKLILLSLVFQLLGKVSLPPEHPISIRANTASEAISDTIQRGLDQELIPQKSAETYARILFVWSFFESGWLADPPGSNDKGSACGPMQLHVGELPPGIVPKEWTCLKIRKDIRLGYAAAFLLLRYLEKKCGSLKSALNAYASDGQCHPWTMNLVLKRCEIAGAIDCK